MPQKYTFPKKFLWGAATSAHQVEGGTHNQWSVWEFENAKLLAKQAKSKLKNLENWSEIQRDATDPNNYISGRAVDHYRRYEEDFDHLVDLNMNAFRFSIEWSRIEPEMGQWDQREIEHYRRYLLALKARGITPVVTMFHWTTPLWFAHKGGFEKRQNIQYFVRFCEKVFSELGEHFRLVCTFNEPEVYVAFGWLHEGEWPPSKRGKFLLGYYTYRNIAIAHNRVVKMARRKKSNLKLGTTKNMANHYAADKALRTKLFMKFVIYVEDYMYLDRTRRYTDWIGVNYYFSNRYHGGLLANKATYVQDLGWEMKPDDISFVLERVYKRYKKPIIITENGVADANDRYRKWWIAHTIDAIHRSLKKGVDVRGYLHWSLIDNFEWAYGKWPKFGLIAVDYRTMKRTPRSSAIWFGKVIKQLRDQ